MIEYQFPKQILVTGGAGFIGSHLIDRLLRIGNSVISLDNLNNFYDPRIKRLNYENHADNSKFKFIEADVRDDAALNKVFEESEIGTVIHLAAMAGVRPSMLNSQIYLDVNINGTHSLLSVIAKYKVERFIFASSSSVYGNNSKIPFSEDDNVDNQISPYGATKKMGEILCNTYYSLNKIPTTCLRFFTVYGPRQRPEMAIHKFVRRITMGETIPFFGDGYTARDYTFIEDIIDGILKALINVEGFSIYNLGNSEPVKLLDLVDIIGKATGKSAVLDRKDLPKGDVLQTYADISRAKQHLDYQPRTHITDGINQFVEWYNESKVKEPDLF
jgi:UDP-glucuronate 4-epimerase